MDIVGFGSSEQEEIFEIIAAILHVGQIDFKHEGNYAKVLSHDIVKIAAQVCLTSSFSFLTISVCLCSVMKRVEFRFMSLKVLHLIRIGRMHIKFSVRLWKGSWLNAQNALEL